jgi:hypothetical protein
MALRAHLALKLGFWYETCFLSLCFNRQSYVHCELLIEQTCTGNGCELCLLSCSEDDTTEKTKHILNYYCTRSQEWVFFVDDPKFNKKNRWAYVTLPDSFRVERLRAFMDASLGKQFNTWGYELNSTCIRMGEKHGDEEPGSRGEYFCSELITVALQDQKKLPGLTKVNPCDTSPKMLYDLLLESNKCTLVHMNPAKL